MSTTFWLSPSKAHFSSSSNPQVGLETQVKGKEHLPLGKFLVISEQSLSFAPVISPMAATSIWSQVPSPSLALGPWQGVAFPKGCRNQMNVTES